MQNKVILSLKSYLLDWGGGICALFTRFLPFRMSSSKIFGIIAIIIAIILLYDNLKQQSNLLGGGRNVR